MSDLTVPPVITSAPAPAPAAAETKDDGAFARMRLAEQEASNRAKALQAQLETLTAEKAVSDKAAAELDEIKRAQMTEMERLRADGADKDKKLSELGVLRDEAGRYKSAIEAQFTRELEAVPEPQRVLLDRLTADADPSKRLEKLADLKAAFALVTPAAPVPPAVAGTRTQPNGGTPPVVTDPVKPRHPKDISWSDAINAVGNRQLGHVPGKEVVT